MKSKYCQITKLKSVENPLFPTPDNSAYAPGKDNGDVSVPVDYTVEGYLLNEIQEGECARMDRRKRNGVEVDGTFQTSQIQHVSTDLAQKGEGMFRTQNSVYEVKILPDPHPINKNLICFNCGSDTGIPQVLHMVIPSGGLKCPNCGAVVAASVEVTY
jgi:hypothetical protein